MRKYWFGIGAAFAGAMALAVMAPATALAANVLTLGSVGGTAVSVSDKLSAGLLSGSGGAKFATSSGTVTCTTSTFTGTVTSNPTAPGTATGTLDTQSFSSCTDNIVGATILAVTVQNLSYNISVTSGFAVTISAGAAGPIQTKLDFSSFLGAFSCTYRATNPPGTLTGTASNATNSIAFSSQGFTKFSGPGTCPGTGTFTASYGPVIDTSQSNQAVFVN
jgi:hypothetical protein